MRPDKAYRVWGDETMTRLFFTVIAVISVLYGLAFLAIPELLGQFYGAKPDDPNAYLNIRFFGSALFSLGLIYWFARDFTDRGAARAVLTASLVSNILGVVLNVWAATSGLLNSLAWSSAAIQLFLALWALRCLQAGVREPA